MGETGGGDHLPCDLGVSATGNRFAGDCRVGLRLNCPFGWPNCRSGSLVSWEAVEKGGSMVAWIGLVDAFLTLVWFLSFLGYLVLLIFTILHCIRRVRPVWRAVLTFVALVIFPLVTVGVYWLVYLSQSQAARKEPGWSAISSHPGFPPPAWAPDPSGRHQVRFWNGRCWTDSVADGGQVSSDPPNWPVDTGH
jgi:hypothetical protein